MAPARASVALPAPDRPPCAARDTPALVAVAHARVGIAVAAAALGSFLPDLSDRASSLTLLVGLVWLPAAVAVLLGAATPGRLVLLGGPAGDLAMVFATHVLVPGAAEAAMVGYVVVVAMVTYLACHWAARALAAAAVVLALAGQALAGRELGSVAALAIALIAIVILIDHSTAIHFRIRARSERLQSKSDVVLAHIASSVVVTDPSGSVAECNPAAEQLLGRPVAEILGGACGKVLRLHLGERALDCSGGCPLLALQPEGVTGNRDVELWRPAAGGRRQPLLVSAAAIHEPGGEAVEVVHSMRDISRLKEAEEAKTLFLATASHELKTPLTVIAGFAQTLVAFPDVDPGLRRHGLQAIYRRTMELSQIVDRLLLSSRIDAGLVSTSVRALDVEPLLRERAQNLQEASGRTVSFESSHPLPLATADPEALVIVIDHLLDNAIKYSPNGEPVRVAVGGNDDGVRITVADQGIGMDPDHARRCFEKFWQAESSDVRRFGGTGIGLYIVKSLVEAMDGTVVVRTVPGAGASFTVTLRPAAGPSCRAPAQFGEATSIREVMRQLGVPEARGR